MTTVMSELLSRRLLGAVAVSSSAETEQAWNQQHRALWTSARQLQIAVRVCGGAEERVPHRTLGKPYMCRYLRLKFAGNEDPGEELK